MKKLTKNEFLKNGPMLLDEIDKPFDSNDYLYEIKFDGIRALIYINNGEIVIRSRNGVVLNDIYPELESIKDLSSDICVFDGEIISLDNGKPSFSKLQERNRLTNKYKIEKKMKEEPVTFMAFDILYKNKDLTNLELIQRKEVLNTFEDTDVFVKSKVFSSGTKLFESIKKKDLEGIIAKDKNSKYEYNTRTKSWIKIKNYKEGTFYICGYLKNKNDYTITVILCKKVKDKYNFVGKCLMGSKNNLFEKIKNEREVKNYIDSTLNNDVKIIKPKYKIKINYIEKTKNGMLRQPFIK